MAMLGAHMSIAGGVFNAPLRGKTVGCNTIQLFTKNSNQWKAKPITEDDRRQFLENLNETGINPAFTHNSYLINLGSPDDELASKSYKSMWEELDRTEFLEMPLIVIHPGSHTGSGEQEGLKRIAGSLKKLLRETGGYKVKIALETTAGQGTSLGCCFEHLAWLLDKIGSDRVVVCYDTCHTFAAGYDIRTKSACKETFDKFDQIIGLKKLAAFHLNDSLKEFGSRIDRHQHIGKGHIGLAGFRNLLNDPRFDAVPMVLETPKGPEMKEDLENLKTLRSLIKKKKMK